ncbi:MAG: TatD related DNase [Candidatus Methanofastidiosum methylothiophilum]|nr:MAG: TatD related DNase [Candidatus Methanofastidiosum methylthiophilus]
MHIDPIRGVGIEAVKEFSSAGGTHFMLVYKTAYDSATGIKTGKDFGKAYDYIIDLSNKINKETNAKSYPIIGLHPAEFHHLIMDFGEEKAFEMALEALSEIENRISEGLAFGIGEVGRPHYDVDKFITDLSNNFLIEVLKLSKKIKCPVQLHTETFDGSKFLELGELVRKYGNPSKVIKHFSPPMVTICEKIGIYPSIIAREKNILKALEEGKRFLMETDYIDDNERPGAVVGPKTVPKTTKKLLEKGILSKEDIDYIHRYLIEEIYGIEII